MSCCVVLGRLLLLFLVLGGPGVSHFCSSTFVIPPLLSPWLLTVLRVGELGVFHSSSSTFVPPPLLSTWFLCSASIEVGALIEVSLSFAFVTTI